ncbi:hypothetical protein BBO99_00004837 [Phytophthora kernoviae]|uniref:Glycosyltransferase family 28 N-terminal domain-containing protein n=1 Tax=Phytophthora kernoviae TaxID=325452 RepID=A0A3R7JS05_9STRA|nr:hypothetical protein BBI17_004821 [Phytophthora kernoviae]RLN79994.1 hypothetical protein BBO99_00004837 [Phytophthora kernoviae]
METTTEDKNKETQTDVIEQQEKPKRWKEAFTRAITNVIEEQRNSLGGKLATFADVVQAAAAFDRDGHIHMDFDEDDDNYDISGLQEQAKHREEESLRTTRQSSKAEYDVPSMSICIMIVGTQGDVQPFVAIAKRLMHDGHRVRLATHAVYRNFVMDHGVEFYPLAGNPKELAAYMVKTGGHLIPLKLETIQKDVPRNMQMIEDILYSTWPAVSEPDPEGEGPGAPGKPFRAQAIISNPVTYGHIHVAERLGVPLHIMFPQPWVPTTAFPHPLSNMPYTGKAKKVNYMSYKMVDLLMWQGTESMVNAFRRDKLQLRKIRKGDGGRDILLDLAIPHAFMWSPRLVPKPNDWGKIYDVIGTVTLEGPSSTYTPSPDLETFLGQDGGPIFVGFGSMVLEDPKGTTKMILEAAEQARVRVLIQSSWSDMAGDLTVPDNVFFLGNCPHDWLMPRVSAVVHHGGAGTTAAGLLAGKPTFIVPFFGDQPFWGRAVLDAGVGVEHCPISELTTEKLRVAFEALESPQLRARAIAMRDLMRQEDGAGEAVRCFYRNLPLHRMRCDLECGRAATLWSQKDKIRLCDQCEFVVASRSENSSADIVEYNFVDYSARGPDNVLEGASAGVGAFAHVFTSGFKDVVVKPAKGYREEGAKGAVIGLVKGLGGLMISPLVGTVVFADHLATGAYNNVQRDDEKRKGSLIADNKKLLNAMGFKTRNTVHNGSMSADEVVDGENMLSSQIAIQLTPEEKTKLEERFNSIIKERTLHEQQAFKVSKSSALTQASTESEVNAKGVIVNVDGASFNGSDSFDIMFGDGGKVGEALHETEVQQLENEARKEEETQKMRLESLNSKQVPKMNVCMMTTGSWEESVQQFVAIGLRLKADGHCVRIATNSGHRDRIINAGLDFYPLGGSAITTGNFLQYLYQRIQEEPRHKSRLLNFAHSKLNHRRESFPEVDDLRELVFSLWPACVEVDPLLPGKAFRADAIIAHPYLFGQTVVAERLGVPLHCMSYNPQSRTQAFPHLISSNMKLHRPYRYAPTNSASYDVINSVLWSGMRDVLDEFRYFLGLTGKSVANNLLAEWRIPHTYLWNSAILPKPHDWGSEITIAGYVELAGNHVQDSDILAIEQELRSFAGKHLDTPLIYFGFQCGDWDPRRVQDLVGAIEKAARKANVRVVFQGYENSNDEAAFFVGGTDVVFEIDQHFPVKRILQHVQAAVHWGDLSITSTCLEAGTPACVVPRNITQRMWGQALVLSGAGVEPLEIDALTPTNLVHVFRVLLDSKLAHCAKRLAPKFSSPNAIETAVSAFYSNLPLTGMTCDLDPSRVARVYDSVHELKLSYEARLVVHQLTGDSGSADDLKYKPLKYSQHQPPRFSLRELDTEMLLSSSFGNLKKPHPKVLYTYDPVSEELAARADQQRASLTSSSSSTVSESSASSKKKSTPNLLAGVDRRRRSLLSRAQSMALNVVELPKFWDSPEEQAKCTVDINAKYEKLLMTRNFTNGSSSSSASSVAL